MASVDDRIVKIVFDNSQFEKNVQTTLATITQLNSALKFENAQKGLSNISQAANRVDISKMGAGIDAISHKFTAMGAVAFTTIQSITNSALGMVKKLGGDILGPIISGGKNRAQNIDNAKFQFRSLGIDVDKAMASSLAAVKGTAFGLDEAAKAAGQFGASGLDAGAQMTQALRGIAGAAALTNRSFGEIADIFTSSAATGKVTNQDLDQFATRGLNATAALAKQLHKSQAEVKQMATDGKLSFAIFSKAMDDAFGKQAQKASETFTGSLANMHAALSRLGASFFSTQLITMRDLFNALTPAIDDVTKAVKPLVDAFLLISRVIVNQIIKVLKKVDFASLGKIAFNVGTAVMAVFIALAKVLLTVKKAFHDIFPQATLKNLVLITKGITEFSRKLVPSASALKTIRRIFDGFFAILSIGWTVIKEGIGVIVGLGQSIGKAIGPSILDRLVKFSDFFVDLKKKLVDGGGIHAFFENLGKTLSKIIPFILDFKNKIGEIFGGFKEAGAKGVETAFGRIGDRFKTLKNIFQHVKDFLDPLIALAGKVKDIISQILPPILSFFQNLASQIADALGKGDFSAVFDILNTVLLIGIVSAIRKFIKTGVKFHVSVDQFTGIFDKIGRTFDQLTNTLKAMQTEIKAKALMEIAKAIAILTASVLVLSLIDSDKLTKALTAMAVGFGELLASFALINQTGKDAGGVKFGVIAAGMILLATAVLILSVAVAILSKIGWKNIAKGLGAVSVILGVLAVTVPELSTSAPGMIATGTGLVIIAGGLIVLAEAVKMFGNMDLDTMRQGLIGIAAGLTIIAIAVNFMPASMPITGAGLILVAVGLGILAGAMKLMGDLDLGEIGRSLLAMAGALIIIATAMNFMPPSLPLTAAGMILIGIALNIMAKALKSFGGMSMAEIGKSLLLLAGALIILAVGVTAMTFAIPGAIALTIITDALVVLVGVMKLLGGISFGTIVHGLEVLGIALGGIALAAILLLPAIPAIFLLGSAMLVLGAAMTLFGVGAILTAKAFELLAKSGKAGADALVSVFKNLGKAVEAFATGLAEGIIGFLKTLTDNAPQIVEQLAKLIGALLDGIVKIIPALKKAINGLIDAIIEIVREQTPHLIKAGLEILLALLKGIKDNIGELTTTVVGIIVNFIDALKEQTPVIAAAVASFILEIITSVAHEMGRNAIILLPEVGKAFLQGLIDGLNQEVPGLGTFFQNLPGNILGWIGDTFSTLIQKGSDLIGGFFSGIIGAIGGVLSWFSGLPGRILGAVTDLGGTLTSKGVSVIGGFFSGLTSKWSDVTTWLGGLFGDIITAVGDLSSVLTDIGGQIIQGLWDGMQSVWHKVTGWLDGLSDIIPFHKGPPAKDAVMLYDNGKLIIGGLQNGMEDQWSTVEAWLSSLNPSDSMNNTIANNMSKVVSSVANELNTISDFNPTITPVLDLTQVASEASKISGFINTSETLKPSLSLSQANTIASDQLVAQEANLGKAPVGVSQVKFEQTINAPHPLSATDVYKQTRNQITLAKEELSIP